MTGGPLIRLSEQDDYRNWLDLAAQVEPLFGPMVNDEDFRLGLRQAIDEKTALCALRNTADGGRIFLGGIVIFPEANEILWLAVTQESRGQGIGKRLLEEALGRLDRARPITVTTFDQTVEAGLPARRLYVGQGFGDASPAGFNPAGIPTVVMTLAGQKNGETSGKHDD